MQILSRYIFRNLLRGILTVTLVLTGIAWLTQILRLFSLVLERGLSMFSFIGLTSLLLPQLIAIVLPLAVFAVVLFTYHRLVMDKEIVVMQAGGASTFQLAKPALMLSLFLCGFSFFSSHLLEPFAGQKFKNLQFAFRNDLSSLALKEDTFNTLIPKLAVYVEKTDGNTLHNLILHDERDDQKTYTVFAKKGVLVQTIKGLSIALVAGSIQEKTNGKVSYGDFDRMTLDLGLMEEKKERRIKPKELYTTTLFQYNEKNKTHYLAEIHKRFLTPLWIILGSLLALIGIFKGSITGRHRGKNLLLTGLGFIGMQAGLLTLLNLLKAGQIHPGIAYGLHLFGLFAGLMILLMKRQK